MNNPILLIFDEESELWEPRTSGGYNKYILPSEVEEIINDLIYYSQFYTDDEIEQYNRQLEKRFFDEFRPTTNKPAKDLSGFVYILKCENRYKVGYSKDVNKRIKQLDTRPFKLELIYKQYSECAYSIEQRIHQQLSAFSVENEWYDIKESLLIENVKEIFKSVEEEILA